LCCGVGAGGGGADEDAEGLEEVVGEVGLGGVLGDGGEQGGERREQLGQQGGQRVAEGERHAHQRLDRVLVLGARGLEEREQVGDEGGRERRQVALAQQAGGGGRDT